MSEILQRWGMPLQWKWFQLVEIIQTASMSVTASFAVHVIRNNLTHTLFFEQSQLSDESNAPKVYIMHDHVGMPCCRKNAHHKRRGSNNCPKSCPFPILGVTNPVTIYLMKDTHLPLGIMNVSFSENESKRERKIIFQVNGILKPNKPEV